MDRIRWQVFKTFLDPQKAMDNVTQSKGTLGSNNSNSKRSEVRVNMMGLGLRRKTVENLVPELPDNVTNTPLAVLVRLKKFRNSFCPGSIDTRLLTE